jgi:serine/threonine protein kinase
VGAIGALLAGGAAVNAATEDGSTPLHVASRNGRVEAARALLAAGASTSLASADGTTPLHEAAAAVSKPCVLALLAAGADPTVRDLAGRWPIQHVPNTTVAPIAGDPVKEAIVDALQTAMSAVARARGDGTLPGLAGTLRASRRTLLLPTTAEEALTPEQIAAATIDPAALSWERRAGGERAELGRGAFGAVYAASLSLHGGDSSVPVAVKHVCQFVPSGAAAGITEEQVFWREVVINRGCSHPNVVRCHGGCTRAGERLLVLERCHGNLCDAAHGKVADPSTGRRAHGPEGAPPRSVILRWALLCLEGLAYLHARDIVHGDVKSDNVLLHDAAADSSPTIAAPPPLTIVAAAPPPAAPSPCTTFDWSRFTAKVSDLGGAALRREENAATADSAYFAERGSPAYMCPALALGHAPLSKASDVYSCGVLLAELLGGGGMPYTTVRVPHCPLLSPPGVTPARHDMTPLYRAVAEGLRPLTPDQLAALQPRGVGSWIAAMTHPSPRMRPPLADVVEAMRVLLGGASETLPRSQWGQGWAECFGVSAAAGGRTRVAAGLLAPIVPAVTAVAPTAAPLVPDSAAGATEGDIMGTRHFGEVSGHGAWMA